MKALLISLLTLSLVFVGCGGSSDTMDDDQMMNDDTTDMDDSGETLGSTVEINGTTYPLYEGSKEENLPGVPNAYKVEAEAESVFDFYSNKLQSEGWSVQLDTSNGTTGQRTFTRGSGSSAEYVMVNVFENGGHTTVMIQPVSNRY